MITHFQMPHRGVLDSPSLQSPTRLVNINATTSSQTHPSQNMEFSVLTYLFDVNHYTGLVFTFQESLREEWAASWTGISVSKSSGRPIIKACDIPLMGHVQEAELSRPVNTVMVREWRGPPKAGSHLFKSVLGACCSTCRRSLCHTPLLMCSGCKACAVEQLAWTNN